MPKDQFALRAQALFVDMVIAMVAVMTVGFVTGMTLGRSVAIMAATVTWAIYSMIELFSAASPGKMVVHLKIAGVYSYQARFGTLLARWAAKNSPWLLYAAGVVTKSSLLGWSGVVVGLAMIVGFFMALRPEGQTLLDRLAGTVVGVAQPRHLEFPHDERELEAFGFRQAA
jgi:uncharacterized RDD family membrane protein YckC